MGTLFDQQNRNHRKPDLDGFLRSVSELATQHKISIAEIIAASHVLELRRRNELYVDNGDAFDEQISGIGELLKQLCSAVEDLKEGETD